MATFFGWLVPACAVAPRFFPLLLALAWAFRPLPMGGMPRPRLPFPRRRLAYAGGSITHSPWPGSAPTGPIPA